MKIRKVIVKEKNPIERRNSTNSFFASTLKNFKDHGSYSFQCINFLKIAHTSIYIALLLLLNMVLLVQIYKCYDRFMKGPTYVETKMVPQQKALFPSITFCAVRGGYKADVLEVQQILYLLYDLSNFDLTSDVLWK